MSLSSVPEIRVDACNRAPVNRSGDYILYWMIAARRVHWNFALDRAVKWSRRLRKPLVILEALRLDFPWATERVRRFVLEGMRDNRRALEDKSALCYPYLERKSGEGKRLLAALAARAAVVVTDQFPCFFLPRMVAAAAAKLPVRLEQVDSNGLLPMRAAGREFSTAFAFRRFLQNHLPEHLGEFPSPDPLAHARIPRLKSLPRSITKRWPMARLDTCGARGAGELTGGSTAARKQLMRFLNSKLGDYPEKRNEPGEDGASGLSPYLHFGHISAHEVFHAIARRERWTAEQIGVRATGKRTGWWQMSAGAEAFLDQLVTWRELGFNCCVYRRGYDRYESLPEWARRTLEEHSGDQRRPRYTLEQLESARTHDALWNAAQRELVAEGRIHNYLRMLWGKKILEWTRTPREALRVMIELNNRYALDGRDPNSYSGILWCLGRYDHPWGPERPVFGTVRYMSSENTARKFDVTGYLKKYTPRDAGKS